MIHILENDNFSLNIDSFGAELKSAKYKNNEYLHEGDELYWKRSSPVLFPIVGKLKDDKYTYNSKTYKLSQHGFARESEFRLESKDTNKIIFILEHSVESLKHYPFKFSLEITYILYENYFEILYKVTSCEDIYFSLGTHPAFKLHSSINDSFIEFEKEELADLYCLDKKSGCIDSKKEHFLDSNIINLQKDTFKNDALIFKNLISKSVILKNTKNKKEVNIKYNNFKNLGLWAPLNAPFICIEPWCGIADDINTNYKFEDKDDIEFLEKGDEFKASLQILFSEKN